MSCARRVSAWLRHTAYAARWCSTQAETVDFGDTEWQVDEGFRDVPVGDKEPLVGKVFENVAPKYDVMNDVMSVGMHRLWKDCLVSKLSPTPGIKHLDVAGGTGDVAFRILDKLKQNGAYDGSVTVLDINEAMLAEGKKKAESKHLSASAEELPFEDSSLDSYTVAFGIRNMTRRDAALSEAHRVLKRGGRFLCLEFSPVDTPVFKDLYDAYSMNVIPKMGKLVANDSESYRYLVESIRKFPDAETFAEQVQSAGFRFVEFGRLTGGVVAIHSGFKL